MAAAREADAGLAAHHSAPAYVGIYRNGALAWGQWVEADEASGEGAGQGGPTLKIANAILTAKPTIEAQDMIAVAFCTAPRIGKLSVKDWRGRLNGFAHRHAVALEGFIDKHTRRWSPFETIVANKTPSELMAEWGAELKIKPEGVENRGRVKTYDAAQYLVPAAGSRTAKIAQDRYGGGAVSILRGAPLVDVREVTQESTQQLTVWLGNYLLNHVHADGHLDYIYRPAAGPNDDGSNNMIRQWMATVAMCRLGHHRGGDADVYATAERNIRFNLRHYYHARAELGIIEYKPEKAIKLGAIALAAIALMEHPKRNEFANVERKLCNTVNHLWEGDSFFTLLEPKSRDFGNNFYPGEALLMWSYLYREQQDPAHLNRFMRAVRHYMDWHRLNRNPAFVPWHTQAYYEVWKLTRDQTLQQHIFEMNDWLIDVMQRWTETRYPDASGRFYTDKFRYGPPHASSDGVYLEGIIDAFRLAREVGDAERAERYRISIVRNLRNIQQLTYRDELEAFLTKDWEASLGGVRTNLHNSDIRCDNVQHILMGIMKVTASFRPEDYQHP